MTSIGQNAFRDSSITNVTIADDVKSIGEYAFYWCSGLTSVTIPDGVATIDARAFQSCGNLTSITISGIVEFIGEDVFWDTAYYNDDANWEDGVLYLDKYLLEADSDDLASTYQIKDGTVLIAEAAFYECEDLVSVTIPDSVTSIGAYAFCRCSSLANVEVSDSVESIGMYALSDTAYYNDDANWEDGVLYLDQYLLEADNNNLANSYEIKAGTVLLADDSFVNCTELESVSIPDSVTYIGEWAFAACENLRASQYQMG